MLMKNILLFALLLLAAPAYGTVYRWVDSAGVRHYTNKEYEIPERYRAKVTILYPDQTDTSSSLLTRESQQLKTDIQPSVPAQQSTAMEQQSKVKQTVITEVPRVLIDKRALRRAARSHGRQSEKE